MLTLLAQLVVMEAGLVSKPIHQSIQFSLNEYLLIAQPNAALKSKIVEEKKLFSFGDNNEALQTPPHITVASFRAKEAMEDTVTRYIQRICMQQQSFDVMLNNYGAYPPGTIYLRVQNPDVFTQLTKQLQVIESYVTSCDCPPVKWIHIPHITISKNLPERLYLKALLENGQKTFHETFMVNELVLLRRTHEMDSGKVINVFRLQPPVNTLFN